MAFCGVRFRRFCGVRFCEVWFCGVRLYAAFQFFKVVWLEATASWKLEAGYQLPMSIRASASHAAVDEIASRTGIDTTMSAPPQR